MMIRREDLVAAAALGLLQYRQIDPLLVFLLQRDVRMKRMALAAQLVAPKPGRASGLLAWLATGLGMVTAALFAILFTTRAVQSTGIDALLVFTFVYAVGAYAVTAWMKRHGLGSRARVSLAVLAASVPVAIFAWQQVSG